MALLSDGSIVASDGENRRIQIFDNGGKFVTSFDTNTELKPKGVCVTMEGKIAVCCGDSVRLFDEGSEFEKFEDFESHLDSL